jgi:hypothetical protein
MLPWTHLDHAIAKYAVRFRGQLPSFDEPHVQIPFETPPILITIGDKPGK